MKPAWKISLLLLTLSLGFSLLALKTIVLAGYGQPGVVPTCNNEKPGTPSLYYAAVAGQGQVKLVWDKADRASSWTIAYGPESGKYVWGISNYGNGELRSFVVNELPNGVYYFVVRANNGCMPGPFSSERSVSVGSVRRVGVATPRVATAPVVSDKIEKSMPTPTQASGQRYVPPTKNAKITPVPTKPSMPIATPTPAPKVGLIQGIVNFFSGLFKAK